MCNQSPDELMQRLAMSRDSKIKQHSELRASDEYQQELCRLQRMVMDFVSAQQAAWLSATRIPDATEDWLTFRRLDDVLESALAIWLLAEQGMLHPARREQRYILESLTKYLVTDQQKSGHPFTKRMGHFERSIAKKSIRPIEVAKFTMLNEGKSNQIRAHVLAKYDSLSTYVHATAEQVRSRTQSASQGQCLGFESTHQLKLFSDDTFDILGLGIVFVSEAIGPSATGDLFIHVWDTQPDWSFHTHEYVAEVSRHFDYKHERQKK